MSLLVGALALGGANLVAGQLSAGKERQAGKERDAAIEKENRKNAISRALGVGFTGTARQLPSGRANTTALDVVGGLSGLGSSLAFRELGKPQAAAGLPPIQQPQSAIGRFNRIGSNIG